MNRLRIIVCGLLYITITVPCSAWEGIEPTNADSAPVKTAADESSKPDKKPRELSPALTALRDQVRRVLQMHQAQQFNTRDNTPTEIMAHCLAFGCAAEVLLRDPNAKRINGITCLCWNYPCSGFELLTHSGDHIAGRIGYGYQEQPGEFLAMLAFARVPDTYPIRVGNDTRTVADLVEAEKLVVRTGGDNSLLLVGLSYYLDEPQWENDRGETWSLERIVSEELAVQMETAPEGGLNRLLGLSYAVGRRIKNGQPLDGSFARAEKYLNDFQQFALQLQNSDGSWGPYFLAAKSTSPDPASQLRSTGRVFEWLALSLPDDKLTEARMVKTTEYLTQLLASSRYRNMPSLSTREIVSAGHALHGLMLYDHRVFKPADPPPAPPAAESPK